MIQFDGMRMRQITTINKYISGISDWTIKMTF